MVKADMHVALPQPGEGKRGQEGYLGYLLRQAASAYRLRLERALSDLGVTPPQYAVLTMIRAYPGGSNADIARVALLTPQTTNIIIGNLERAGLIGRRPHPVHGRILQVELTLSGQEVLQSCNTRVQVIENELVPDLTAEETAIIRRWLASVARLNESRGPRHPHGNI